MSELDAEYRLDYFEEEGFTRSQCDSCGDWFWSRDPDRETCGEPPCAEYAFIDDPGFDESFTLEEMREEFLSYFEDAGHERIPPRPVAANRWRDDVLLTQASIYGFQPHVTSGRTPPPANPLAVSQPCIRMNDIDNVGKTGRHTMAFEMMGHHAFNADEGTEYAYEGEVYWKDRCVELCEGFFERFGVDLTELTFIEDPWVGGGNAGPAFEVIYKGAELATLVFMSMEVDPDGDYELKDGNTYSFMDRRVIDTGYGLERWTWMSQGTPTVYEAIYPETIEFLKENVGIEHTDEEAALIHEASKLAGKLDIDDAESFAAARAEVADELGVDADRLTELLEPLEGIYAIADHCRTLAYMLGDEIVPSSAGTGYLARKVLRRTKRIADEIGVDAPLDELVDMQAERLGYENRDTIRDMVRTEVRSYRETLQRGRRRVRELARETDGSFPTEELIELYNSHGIQPETVAEIAAEEGTEVDVPDDFYGMVAQRHEAAETAVEPVETDERLADLPETEKRYYEDQDRTSFEAVVLDTFERENGYDVVLDGTLFYPEGGGQPADHGTLSTDEASVRVTDVQDHDGVIVHRTGGDLDTGSIVRGQVDAERRRRLMQHHTATHVIGHAAREVLGGHIRQAGAQKGTDSARLDVSHYDRITRDEREEIELVANRLVRENLQVQADQRDRNEAEAEFGFDLYQGGVPPGETIRTITVGPDTQACGGTHVSHTGEIGTIKLLNTEPVQDGVERLTFAAGEAAITATHETERALADAAETLDVEPTDVPATAERFFEEWKDRGKEIDRLKEELATARAAADDAATEIAGTPVVIRRDDTDADELRATANAIVADGRIAVLGSGAGGSASFVVGVPDGVPVDAGEVVAALARRVGGGGGGPPDFAQGGGPNADALDDALDEADEVLASVAEAQ